MQPIFLLDETVSLKPPTVLTRLVFSRVVDSKVISHHDMSKGLMWIFYDVALAKWAILKRCVQKIQAVAQKMSLPCPFEIQKQIAHKSDNFKARNFSF